MCGIAGIFNLKTSKSINQNHLQKLNQDLANRGPDQTGTIIQPNFGFTHRRLSILSPQANEGKQPIIKQDIALTYNGELYNFANLKQELKAKGEKISSNCDTETLFYFLEYNNFNNLEKLDGMFAFASYHNNKLYLVRDVSGKKPLYYTIIDNQLYFSSSLKSLADLKGQEYDYTALIFCLLYGAINFGERTIFKDIYTVEPGYKLVFQKNRNTPYKYQFISFKPEKKYYNLKFDDAQNQFKELLENSVKKRLISDVPIGSYLSGGLDSTIITSIAKKYKEELRTYSICYNDLETRENTYAIFCSKKLKTNHTALTPDFNTYQQSWQDLIKHKGAPLSTSNEVLIHTLAQESAKKLKVVLSGEGADELLYGYGAFSRSPFDFYRFILKDYLAKPKSFEQSLNRLYGKQSFFSLKEHLQTFYRRFNEYELLQIFSTKINISNVLFEIDSYFESLISEIKSMDLYTIYNYTIYKINLQSLLNRLDFNTMHASLEARAPFLDKQIVDFALNIPFKFKLKLKNSLSCLCSFNTLQISERFDTTKYILRKAFENDIPKEILTRPKQSFPIPHHKLYNNKGRERLFNKLTTINSDDINNQAILRWFETYNSEKFSFKLWAMENFINFLSK